MDPRRARALLAVLGLALLSALALASPAQAATSTVTLGQQGPSPSTVTVKPGDTVTFANGDTVSHTLKATSKGWTLSRVLKPSERASVTFASAGTYDYSDTYPNAILGISQTADGHVVVPAQPSPSSSPSASSRPSATTRPTTAPTAAGSPTVAPTQSGVAVPPPIVGGQIPTAAPTTSVGPAPQVAPNEQPAVTASPSPGAASVDYADPRGLVQSSPHGFGLPTALAVVAVVGVATLIVRLLLAQPEAQTGARPDVQ